MKEESSLEQKILRILKKENVKMNPLEIMRKMNPKFNSDELSKLVDTLYKLEKDGIIRSSSGNTYLMNDLIVGVVDMHEKGNAHIIADGYEDIFIQKNHMKGAYHKDTVLVCYIGKERSEGKIVKIIKRSLGKSIGEIINQDGELTIKVYGEEELPYVIEVEESNLNLVDGDLVHLEFVRDIDKKRVLARIDRVMGHKNALLNEGQEPSEISGEIVKIACEFDLRLMFPDEVKKEAEEMPKELSLEMIMKGLEEGREDFRKDIIFTIDGKDTKDIDDAISVKILPNGNYELGVHIADVTHYVRPGSALWKEAELRGNSNYLGNKVIPMLPVELSNGICSLNPNEDRFTISCVMEVDHSGKVLDRRVTKGIICSKKKMNYDAVQDIIDGKDTEDTVGYDTLEYTVKPHETLEKIAFENGVTVEDILKYNEGLDRDNIEGKTINVPAHQIIRNMYDLSKKITSFKERRGELKFSGDEIKVVQDENDNVIDIKARDQRPSERIIEDFMVAANEQICEFLNEYGLATFRVHAKPLEKKMREYLEFLEGLGIHYSGKIDVENISSKDCQMLLEYLKDEKAFKCLNKKLLRCMQKAVYSTENIGHFGIASPCYTHFTSPIRRFDDTMNHQSLTQILKHKKLEDKFIESWHAYLTTLCNYISDCERNSEKCEYAVDDMLKASYMEQHIGEEFDATVDGCMQGAFFVQTDNYIDGRVDVIEKSSEPVDGEEEVEVKYVGIPAYYDYNEKLNAYTRNGRVDLRYGDKVRVKCIAADREKREIDFALIRKI